MDKLNARQQHFLRLIALGGQGMIDGGSRARATLQALERRGLVELQRYTEPGARWSLDRWRLTPAGAEAAMRTWPKPADTPDTPG